MEVSAAQIHSEGFVCGFFLLFPICLSCLMLQATKPISYCPGYRLTNFQSPTTLNHFVKNSFNLWLVDTCQHLSLVQYLNTKS